jgi:C-terminal processing protease CtpA/Prc
VSICRPSKNLFARSLSLPEGKGLLLSEVVNDSPAKKAGLQLYDVVLGVEKLDLTKTEDLAEQVQRTEGKPIELRLIRHAKPLTLSVTPIERPQATVELSLENKPQLLLSRVLLANEANAQKESVRWLLARNNVIDSQVVLNLQMQDAPTQIANLQAELARMTASATAMQEQLQKLAEQIKQTPKK